MPELTFYRLHWKHKDFPKASAGPILRHSRKGATKKGIAYTKKEVEESCTRLNLHAIRHFVIGDDGKRHRKAFVKHWIEELKVKT